MSTWQTMENAPKDGTRVFVYGTHSSLYSALGYTQHPPAQVRAVAYWDGSEWVMTTPDETPTVDVYEDEWDGPQKAGLRDVTAWMPLPSPPSDTNAPKETR